MRLTHVTHLRLPFGRLWGYDVSVAALDRRLPVSFDQRIHVGAGDRPGSWMGISFRLPARATREVIADAWLAVIARHGTLRTAFLPDAEGNPQLQELAIGPGSWVEHEIAPGQAVNDAIRHVLDAACSPYQQPSHKLCLLDTAAGMTVVVAADHAHVDMWSMLVIARDLLTALDAVAADREPWSAPVPAFEEHTRALLARDPAPEQVRRRWADIIGDSGGAMPRFPLSLGAPGPQRERVEVRDVLDPDDSAAFAAQAREEGVSTLALAVVAMTAVTRTLAGTALRAIFPVHSRYEHTWHDSVGWFITNSVLESSVAEPRAAAAAVKEAVQLGSWPLADVLAPWGGMPVAPGMFAISWLDLRRLPVRIDSVGLDAQYVGAAIDTDGVMLWFILDESGLHLRCRYPDTAEARTNVGGWLDLLVARLQADARTSVRGMMRVAGSTYRMERAGRDDIEAIAALLADGRSRGAALAPGITGGVSMPGLDVRVALHDGFEVDTDRSRLDLERVHRWLSTDAFWAIGRSSDLVRRAAAASTNFGVYDPDGAQVGYARLVTDGATFGWLCDVYIAREARGRGIGTALAQVIVDAVEPLHLKRLMLATLDAHEVYARAGFVPFPDPEMLMMKAGSDG